MNGYNCPHKRNKELGRDKIRSPDRAARLSFNTYGQSAVSRIITEHVVASKQSY